MNIFIILCIIAFGYVIINHILDINSKQENVPAVLINKNIETIFQDNNIVNANYILTFKFNNTIKHFAVKYSSYNKYNKYDKGILTYQRNLFIDFKKEK